MTSTIFSPSIEVLQLVENGNLKEAIEEDEHDLQSTKLYPGARLRVLYQIASALQYLHKPQKYRFVILFVLFGILQNNQLA